MAKSRTYAVEPDFLDRVDCVIAVYKEKIPNNGEDAYLFSANSCAAVVGAFDGCGGSGAKRHAKLQGKTGAYAASRIVSGTVKDWFSECGENNSLESEYVIKQRIKERLQICHNAVGEESKLVSPIVKVFPTTAAFALFREEKEKVHVDYFWAGDSRVYLLNSDGLAQLSVDDLSVPDAMENLYDDGVMTNVISKSKDFTIHHGRVAMDKPGIVFAATDGCFGYVSSPMEFEYMLLETLMDSNSISEWERKLSGAIGKVAGDDYTLSGIAIDHGTFEVLHANYINRANRLYSEYISKMNSQDREGKSDLWNRYKHNYYRFQMPA